MGEDTIKLFIKHLLVSKEIAMKLLNNNFTCIEDIKNSSEKVLKTIDGLQGCASSIYHHSVKYITYIKERNRDLAEKYSIENILFSLLLKVFGDDKGIVV